MTLTVEVYATGTTPIADPLSELARAREIEFSTCYPGGLSASGSFFVPRDASRAWEVLPGLRVAFRRGQSLVYEGYVTNISSGAYGNHVTTIGGWGHILMNWYFRKWWADQRYTDDAWRYQTAVATYLGANKCNLDRNNRIRFTPKAEAWANNDFVAVRHTQPVGQTTKRIKYNYDMQEAAQAWEVSLWRSTDGSSWTQMTNASGETYAVGTTTVITTSSATAIDVTLQTASRYVEFRYYSRAGQTPASDGTYYGEFSDITVYSETGAINMEEVAKDVVDIVTSLNTGTQFITASATALELDSFVIDRWTSASDVLMDAVERGDAGYNRWAAYILPSSMAFVPDGKPLLALEAYASISDYDYTISLREHPELEISEDIDSLRNRIGVEYTDPEGLYQVRTGADNAALYDNTSTTNYGRHSLLISLGESTSTLADSYGISVLARLKDPQYHWVSSAVVSGAIEGKGGNRISAAEVRAGRRIRVSDYKGGHTWVITQTQYDDETDTVTITVGAPDLPLPPRPPAEGMMKLRDVPMAPAPTSSGGRRDDGVTISDKQLAKWGLTRQQWWAIKATARGKALRASLKKKKRG